MVYQMGLMQKKNILGGVRIGDVFMNTIDIIIGYIIAICGLCFVGMFVIVIPTYFIIKNLIDCFFDFKHGYCSKCHHKLKYEKYVDNVFYGCSKCDNFVKVKHNVIKENKYE